MREAGVGPTPWEADWVPPSRRTELADVVPVPQDDGPLPVVANSPSPTGMTSGRLWTTSAPSTSPPRSSALTPATTLGFFKYWVGGKLNYKSPKFKLELTSPSYRIFGPKFARQSPPGPCPSQGVAGPPEVQTPVSLHGPHRVRGPVR
ncbi:hypothetical protein ABZP36_034462 [Zizania latifolia]